MTSTLLFLFIEKIGWYRVTPEDQDKGLDFIKHDDAAYHFGNCISKCPAYIPVFALNC